MCPRPSLHLSSGNLQEKTLQGGLTTEVSGRAGENAAGRGRYGQGAVLS